MAKVGTTLQGLVNSLMISVSLGLQYGVPLEVYVSKFAHMRFEPAGLTNDADIRTAKSIVDYIFRWMGKKFLTVDQQEEIGILSPEVRARLAQGYANGGTARGRGAGRTGGRSSSGPDGAVQRLGGRGRVLQVRRPDGAHRLLLHVPGLRDEHRLQLKCLIEPRSGHRIAPWLPLSATRLFATPASRTLRLSGSGARAGASACKVRSPRDFAFRGAAGAVPESAEGHLTGRGTARAGGAVD